MLRSESSQAYCVPMPGPSPQDEIYGNIPPLQSRKGRSREERSLLNEPFEHLTSTSTLKDFSIGTGRTIFGATLIPAILSARHEIVLATCFWAHGPTLESLNLALKQLSSQITANGSSRKIRVYICLSSRSILQKLFHTSSKYGYIYPPDSWNSKLGLPSPAEIPGLQLVVKSLFFRPFSVLHSKYLIIDRQDVWMPSCNVSWEEWYECSVHLRGQVVNQIFSFWLDVWSSPNEVFNPIPVTHPSALGVHLEPARSTLQPLRRISFAGNTALPTTLLPHPHNASISHNLWFPPFHIITPPQTQLNTTLLHLFKQAKQSITLLTPNFTSPPVYAALLTALARGINLHIITNRRMMILEQLLTSGTITEWWLWRLKRAHERLVRRQLPINDPSVIESGRHRIGSLRIDIFSPPCRLGESSTQSLQGSGVGQAATATKVHIKLTMVDEEAVVLGSGNMDRASWYTSQELGVLLRGRDVVQRIWSDVQRGLEGCLDRYV